jgi:hypothetical protein
VTRLKWNIGSVRLETVLLLMQDWCTICVKHSVGSKIVFEATDGILGDVGHVESRFDLF